MGLVTVGCQFDFDTRSFEPWVERELDVDIHDADVSSQTPTTGKRSSTRAVQIPPNAGPEDYVRLALQRNPQIKAALQRVERLKHRVDQATSLDDPIFKISAGEMAETAAGRVDLVAGISQRFPTPGKLEAKGKIANQETVAATAQLEQTKRRVVADVQRAYWSYYFAARAIEVTRQSRTLLEQFREVAESKLRAGKANQQDVLRASVELSHLDKELIQYRQRHTIAAAMINNLLDRPIDASLPQPSSFKRDHKILTFDTLLKQAFATSPEILTAKVRLDTFRHRLRLARLEDWPDMTLGVHYAAVDDEGLSGVANGDDQWWVTAGFTIPIWPERRDAVKQEAVRGIGQSVSELRGVKNSVAFRVQDALTRVESHQAQLNLIEKQIIPEAKQTVEVSVTGYRAGNLDFLTLTDNWRKLLRFELMREQTFTQLEQAHVDLQEVVGRSTRSTESDHQDTPGNRSRP